MINERNNILKDWIVFIKVIECGSISVAAHELNRSISTVSKTVAKLESTLRTQLLSRNARNFEITTAGKKTYEKVKALYSSYQDFITELDTPSGCIQGDLRVTAPSVLCDSVIPSWIINYTEVNPDVAIHIKSMESGSLSAGSVEFDDLVIKSGYIESPDLVYKKINPVPFGVYASPDYLARNKIETPDDLKRCSLLKLQHSYLSGALIFKDQKGYLTESILERPAFSSNNINSLIQMTIAGLGVCLAVPSWTVEKHLKNGELMTVLPELHLPPLPSYLVWRYRNNYSLLFKDFIMYFEARWNNLFS